MELAQAVAPRLHPAELVDEVRKAVDGVWDPWLGVLVVAVVVGFGVLRGWWIRRLLREREELPMLPADEFDPSREEIERFGFQLARVRRRGPRGWLSRPASAVRVKLELADGQMLFAVGVPGHARSLLRSATYTRCELRGRSELDVAASPVPSAGAVDEDERRPSSAEVLVTPFVEPEVPEEWI